jgi:hypothetical protein
MIRGLNKTFLSVLCIFIFSPVCAASRADSNSTEPNKTPVELHGFYEMRAGYRTQNDKYEKDMSIMENRLQLDLASYPDWGEWRVRGDFIGDLVTEEGNFDLREAYIFRRPFDFMDFKGGRQILTWGTGDLVFINDLFPKDYVSFFIGRDEEYLKAPSDAAKVSLFSDFANLDIVYSPTFDSDRYITGERLSYWNSDLGRLAGQDAIIHTEKPNQCFKNDEIAARLYKNIKDYEFALYAYHGYWKSPAGQNASHTKAIFPPLNVYGASARGNIAKGIGNVEFGYYDSTDDQSGTNGLINNSQLRFLVGYSQEIGKDFTAGLQYYAEYMLDYDQYKKSNPVGLPRDRNEDYITLRLTKLLMNQNLRFSWFSYFPTSDSDFYMRTNLHYKVTDNLAVETGTNIFYGAHPNTFFGEFRNDTNVYVAVRYTF